MTAPTLSQSDVTIGQMTPAGRDLALTDLMEIETASQLGRSITGQQLVNLINSLNLSGLASYTTAQDNLRLHKGAISVDLQANPNYQITNPPPTTIEIETSDNIIPGGKKIILPAFNASFSMRAGDYFVIENHSTNIVTLYYSDTTTAAATIPTGHYLFCSPRNNSTANGSLFTLTGATDFDSGVAGIIATSTITESQVLNLVTDLAAKQPKYRSITSVTSNLTVGTAHASGLLLVNSGSAVTITVPQTSTTALNAGYWFDIINIGAGTVTVVKEGSDTLGGNTECDTGAKMSVVKDVAGSPNGWQTAGGTSVIPVQYSVSFYDIQNTTDAYPCTPLMSEVTTFTSLTRQCDGTSVVGNFLIGASAINGGTITTNGTLTTTSLTSNNVAAVGTRIKFVATAVTTPKNATFLFSGTVRRS